MAERVRLLVALVLSRRAAAEVDGLRRALGGPLERIAAHLTLVPPRNVASDDLETVLGHLAENCARAEPLRLLLGEARTFAPVTPVVYLAVGGDLERLGALAATLSTGVLAPPPTRSGRDFVPHVTLANRLDPAHIEAALAALGAFSLEVVCDRVTLLEQDEEGPTRPWHAVADFALAAPAVVGRGGRELAFSTHASLDASARAFFERAWSAYEEETYGALAERAEQVALVARSGEEIVAVALGSTFGTVATLDRLVVDAAQRATGIGAGTLAQFERVALEHGCETVRLLVRAASLARTFYEVRGYREVTTLANWRGAETFCVLERALVR